MRVLRDGAEHSARSLAARLCLGHYDLGVFLRQLERAGAVESRLVGEKRAYRLHAASGVVAARRGPGLVVSPEEYDALHADLAAVTEPGPVPGEFGAALYEEFDDEGDTDGYFQPVTETVVQGMTTDSADRYAVAEDETATSAQDKARGWLDRVEGRPPVNLNDLDGD